jgi:hypothetical protein
MKPRTLPLAEIQARGDEGGHPVYITYTTMGLNVNGQMTTYKDIYGRDGAVLTSLHAPRVLHTTQRTSTQEVIVADDPL